MKILLGKGSLNWRHWERRTDRYGTVDLLNAEVPLKQIDDLLSVTGTLTATIISTRASDHIGDILRGLSPHPPMPGEEFVLGKGELFFEQEFNLIHVGVRPADGRYSDWLDPKELYQCHNQIVELYFEEDNDGKTESDA
jgi:hypothetical protein